MNKKRYKDSAYIIYEDGRCYSEKTNKFLTPKMTVKYPTYNLSLNGSRKQIKVHRMVAETFILNPENRPIVNHIDGNTHNFSKNNLEWVSYKENSQHAIKNGLMRPNDQSITKIEDAYIAKDEIWKPIINFPNYLVSNYGRIMNACSKRIKKTPVDNNGYPHVSLWRNGKGKTYQVHRIEFQTFFPDDALEGFVINHINGNKVDNKLTNLEKISYQENNLHAEYIIKTHKNGKAVIQRDLYGKIINEFPSIAEAERQTGLTNISRAIKKQYQTQGYYWEFKK